jgi:hypothetical protein
VRRPSPRLASRRGVHHFQSICGIVVIASDFLYLCFTKLCTDSIVQIMQKKEVTQTTLPKKLVGKKIFVGMLLFLVLLLPVLLSSLQHKPSRIKALVEGNITSQVSSNPPSGKQFTLLPPGSALPSDQECTKKVRRSTWEPRSENDAANHRIPTAAQIAALTPWTTASLGIQVDPRADIFRKRVTGNFTGTTDEILQWAACKWGMDEDYVRAEAVTESHWHQSELGDITGDQSLCPPGSGYPGAWNGSSCAQSYSIIQIKYLYNKSAWPMSRDDTAFAIDYQEGILRYCYEGWATYLGSNYRPGDIWGCIGRWFSGQWHDSSAQQYIGYTQDFLNRKVWLTTSGHF